jgi:hypothetical protein
VDDVNEYDLAALGEAIAALEARQAVYERALAANIADVDALYEALSGDEEEAHGE